MGENMKNQIIKSEIIIGLVIVLIASNGLSAIGENTNNKSDIKSMTIEFSFSYPTIVVEGENIWAYVNESDLNMVIPDRPVLPVNISLLEFEFGTEILSIDYEHSDPEIIEIPGTLPITKSYYQYDYLNDNSQFLEKQDLEISLDPFPVDWISYHNGGGLSHGEHTTFLTLRVYPLRYFSNESYFLFIDEISVTIDYVEPSEQLLNLYDVYDLLIISPSDFAQSLKPLVDHKDSKDVKTNLVTLEEVYDRIHWEGRDDAEKIKYFIKKAIEEWGISYVLLVGGIKGQTLEWNLPVRHSQVVPPVEQEYAELSFICDLYFADIYDSEGEFSSWDSNFDDEFSVWNKTFREEMDLYPDVYLGRLPCRNIIEVKNMVDKIVKYEEDACDEEWFNNLVLVAGDSYNDEDQFNEGELIAEEAILQMPEFTPVRVYTSEQDISRRTVNRAMNPGSGFAYFCGHGSAATWNTHYPPDGTEWATGYSLKDMIFLRNRHKLPITIVGGCHNGQFDVTMSNILLGIKADGFLGYFSLEQGNAGKFWYNEWVPNCWAWWLTSKKAAGAIATIANTGLGTHGDGDLDNNGIADYLEVLNGWMELRFLEMYGEENYDILGENHGDTLSEYLQIFYGNNAKMDVKMIQQWELFGDPSLKIGGYNT